MKIGELVAIARECKGWTLRDLERETGVSNALISQIEHGHVKDPGFSTVVKLCRALGLSVDRAASTVVSLKEILGVMRAPVAGKVTGLAREGDRVPGMPQAICHACGLGYKCLDADCPNEKRDPTWPDPAPPAGGR